MKQKKICDRLIIHHQNSEKDKGGMIQFKFKNEGLQNKWHRKLLKIKEKCSEFRGKIDRKFQTKSIFTFSIHTKYVTNSDVNLSQQSVKLQKHYFCCDSFEQLEEWKKCLNGLRADISINKIKQKYDGDKTLNKVEIITNRDINHNHTNSTSSIIDAMSVRINKHKKTQSMSASPGNNDGNVADQSKGLRIKSLFSEVNKTMRYLIQQMNSNKYDSIELMAIHIDKIYVWFFGDSEHEINEINTQQIIEYILNNKDEELFWKLFQTTKYLRWNPRKQMLEIISEIIQNMDKTQCYKYIIGNNIDDGYSPLINALFDSYDTNYNLVIMQIVKHPDLINVLLNTVKIQSRNRKSSYKFVDMLLKLMKSNNLMILAAAYDTFHCLLTSHNDTKGRKYVFNYFSNFEDNVDGIFSKLNKLIFYNENYLIQRNGLKVLFTILTLKDNDKIKKLYIENQDNVKHCIDLLRYNNAMLSFEIWKILKLVIINGCCVMIQENKQSLISLLSELDAIKAGRDYNHFVQDRKEILEYLNE